LGIVDDKAYLLNSLKENLSLFPDIEISWSANNGLQALNRRKKKFVEVILMDIEMPEMDGVEATRKIKEEIPDTKIIMLTVFDNSDKIFDAILAGASGYLLKDSLPSKIHLSISKHRKAVRLCRH